MANSNPVMQGNEIDGEPIIIDEADPASNAAIDVVGLDNNIDNNVGEEASANDDVDDDNGDNGDDSSSEGDEAGDVDDDDDDDDVDDVDGEIDKTNSKDIDEDNADDDDGINNSNKAGTTAGNNTYYPLKEISKAYQTGPPMVNSKFKAYQKIEVEVGLYYFGAQVTMTEKEDDGSDGSFIEHGDMFEGGFFFLTTAYSEELDDLQFIFVRQSWFEKCPETDDFGGNYSNARGF